MLRLVKKSGALNETHLTIYYGMTLAMWDHSVTCNPSERTPPLSQPDRPVLDLPTPEGWKSELTSVTGNIPRWFIRLQMVSHLSINWAVHSWELNSQHVDHKSNVLTTSKPNPDPPVILPNFIDITFETMET